MITHIVLFKPHESLTDEQKQSILDAVVATVGQCPTVRSCRIGRRVLLGRPGYEQEMREDYQFALLIDFDDLDGLAAYLTHPGHARLGGFFTNAASASLAYDYEVVPLEQAKQ
jgi:hypothetical protein